MKSLPVAVLAFVLAGCSGNESPTAPTVSTPVRTTGVSGYVYSASGACLGGAVVEILDGVRAGLKTTQTACGSPWDDAGQGYFFELPENTYVRLRASMNGYASQEKVVLVDGKGGPDRDFALVPVAIAP